MSPVGSDEISSEIRDVDREREPVRYLERRPMSINKELITSCVPIAPPSAGMSEQSVGKTIQRAQLSLVTLPADVDNDSLAACHDAVMRNGYIDRVMTRRVRTVGELRLT